MVVKRGARRLRRLTDLLSPLNQSLGQLVGYMEGEVALDDGDAGRGGHGPGRLAFRRGQIAQDRILLSGFFVVTQVGVGKRDGVVAAGDGGDVVPTEDDRDDGDGGVPPSGAFVIVAGKLGDPRPRRSEGSRHGFVKVVVDLQKKATQGVRMVATAADLIHEHIRIDAALRRV